MSSSGLLPTERRAAISLAGIFALRMLGLFMIYPVFAVAAKGYAGASATTIGIALGIYGLTQACLQIPFGLTSDRVGRKPVITLGLLLFVAGSVIAALSHGIGGIIIGRAIQGGGAVGSVILALTADLTRVEQRTKAIGTIGVSIGFAFMVALVIGPVVNGWMGLSGLFWLTAVLGVGAIIVVWIGVPTPRQRFRHKDAGTAPAMIARVLKNSQLLKLDASIFMQHAILAALFLVIPVIVRHSLGIGAHLEWGFYLPIMVLAFVLMIPFVILAETRHRMKGTLLGGVIVIGGSLAMLLGLPGNQWIVGGALCAFFAAFTILEALLPSLVSKVAPIATKGTAMGVYSSGQFFGIFVGGALGGFVDHRYHTAGLLMLVLAASVLWFLMLLTLRRPPHYASRLVSLPEVSDPATLVERLQAIPGIIEAEVAQEEKAVYLKVNRQSLDEDRLSAALS